MNQINYRVASTENSVLIEGGIELIEQKISSAIVLQKWSPQVWMQDIPYLSSTGRFSIEGQHFSLDDVLGTWTLEQSELIVDSYIFDELSLRGNVEQGQIEIPEIYIEHELFDMEATTKGDLKELLFDVGAELKLHSVELDHNLVHLHQRNISIRSHISVQGIKSTIISQDDRSVDYPDLDISDVIIDMKGRYADSLTGEGKVNPKYFFC